MIALRLTRALTLCAALFSFSAPQATAQTAFEPVAVINDQVVTLYDVDQRARLLRFNGAPDNEALGRIAFDQIVEDRLKFGAGERFGVEAAEQDVANAIDDFARQRGLSAPELLERLERIGVGRTALEDALGAELVWRTLVRRRFSAQAEPSEAELDQEIALSEQGRASSFRLAEIAIPFSARGEGETRAFAASLAQELRRGGDFAAAARRHSRAPSARQGGEIGWIPASALPPEVSEAAEAAEEGAVIGPVDVPGGVGILKLLDIRSNAAPWVENPDSPEAREQLREQIRQRRFARLSAGWLQDLRGDAVIDMRR